jgi:short-subunit dehydrogenase
MEPKSLVVVTGASSGIGRATALRFAKKGFRVVAVARGREALEALAREGAETKGRIFAEALDAADGEAVLAMASRVLEEHGTPAVLVNSAGAGRWLDIEDTSPTEIAEMMGAPFFAAFHMCHAFVRPMRDAGHGVIVHVGSPASLQPWPGATGYTCSRWALRGLHEALRVDLEGTGVSTCHVIFGEVTSAYFEHNPGAYARIPAIGKMIPKMTPDDCADVLYEVAHAPRAEVIEPFALRAFVATQSVSPAIARTLATRTGRKRD